MWIYRYFVLGLLLVGCAKKPTAEREIEKMALILEEMIRANQTSASVDSLAIRREAVFKKHETNEVEVRAWIQAVSRDVPASQELASRLSVAMETDQKPPSYTDGRKSP